MDIKKLILEVEKRAEIWNPNHHLHHKRARIVEIWNKISARTGFSSNLHITKNHLQLDSDRLIIYRGLVQIEVEIIARQLSS